MHFSPSNWTNVVGLKPAGKGSVFFFRATRQESFAVLQFKRLLHFKLGSYERATHYASLVRVHPKLDIRTLGPA